MKTGGKLKPEESKLLPLLLLAFCLLLCALVPYVHDDWDWGSSGGMQRLGTFFAGYNGRYAGNLLVMALTRISWLKTLVMGGVLFATLRRMASISGGKTPTLLVGTLLFFSMSMPMAEQSIGWLSAFCNYAPPTLVLLVYIAQAMHAFDKEASASARRTAAFALMGFLGALFMENVTVCLCLLSIGVVLISSIHTKRVYAPTLFFMVGALAGAACMFSNSVYLSIAQGKDSYRTMTTSTFDTIAQIAEQAMWDFRTVHLRFMFKENWVILVCVAVCSLVIYSQNAQRVSGAGKAALLPVLAGIVLYPLYIALCARHADWEPLLSYSRQLDELLGIAYILCIALLGFVLPLPKSVRLRLSLLTAAIALLAGPLIFVTPIGARCFYPIFVLEIPFVLELFACSQMDRGYKTLRPFAYMLLGALMVFWLSIYARNKMGNDARVKSAREQAAAGNEVIVVSELPYPDYSWDSHVYWINDDWFKDFYGLPEAAELKSVTYEEFYQLFKADK